MRGTQRSRPMADIVAEARALAARGVREVHLVAQDLTHYGFDLPGRPDLVDLTRELAGVEGIVWVRLLYAHPAHLTRRMQEQLFGVPKVLPYLDMPIQHASDTVLRAMRRPYTAARVRQQVLDLRRRVAGITLRTTVIVGFPGENERDFAALCRFVEEMRFDRLGVFAYSREPGTASYALPGRPRTSSVERRMHELSTLQMHIAAERAATRLGTRTTLLVDGLVADLAAGDRPPIAEWTQVHGRTPAEALDIDGTVFAETVGNAAGNAAAPGDLLEIEIVAHDVFDLRARVLPSKAATDGSTARPEP
jgi:ribosomal protein S12 methylthiotransferase